jgi:hypothetical protein
MQIDRDESIESQLVTKFVRYALACEYARIPIRKEGVKEKGQSCCQTPARSGIDWCSALQFWGHIRGRSSGFSRLRNNS